MTHYHIEHFGSDIIYKFDYRRDDSNLINVLSEVWFNVEENKLDLIKNYHIRLFKDEKTEYFYNAKQSALLEDFFYNITTSKVIDYFEKDLNELEVKRIQYSCR